MGLARLIRAAIMAAVLGLGLLVVVGLGQPETGSAYSGQFINISCSKGKLDWCRSGATATLSVSVNGASTNEGWDEEYIDYVECSGAGVSTTFGLPFAQDSSVTESTQYYIDVLTESTTVSGGNLLCTIHLRTRTVIYCSLMWHYCDYGPQAESTRTVLSDWIKIDLTPPYGTVTVTPNQVVYGQIPTVALATRGDQLSGYDTHTCNPLGPTGLIGTFYANCRIYDNAGNSQSVNSPYTVSKADATALITGRSIQSSIPGQAVTVSYTVTGNAPAVVTPTGNVTVSDGVDSCTATVAAGSCSLTLTTAGSRTLTASYAGDTRVKSATSAGVNHQVDKAGVSLYAFPEMGSWDGEVGQPMESWLYVTAAPPATGTPTGTVTWSDGVDTCTTTAESGGDCYVALTTPGTRTVTVTYGGDAKFASASTTVQMFVSKGQTGTGANQSDDATVVGEPFDVHFSVWKAGASPLDLPGGTTVTVSDGDDSCSASVSEGTCSLRLTTPGDRTITIAYPGTARFAESQTTLGHTVAKADTKTTITGHSPAPSGLGSPVTVTWSVDVVAPGHGNPGGQVTVSDGEVSCSAPAGDGQCDLTPSSMGLKQLVATYEGSARFSGSTSDAVDHRVKAASATAIDSVTPGPASGPGDPFSVVYHVTGDGGTPTGTVTVSWGTDQCTASVADGECTITPTGVGSKPVQAVYEGDTDFVGSTSSGVAHSVGYTFAWSGPKAPPSANTAKAGARLALRFTLGGSYGKAVLAAGYPRMQTASCRTWATSGRATGTSPAGSAGVSVSGAGVYSYGWKTSAAWFKGKPVCKVVTLKLKDGTTRTLRYRFTGKQ